MTAGSPDPSEPAAMPPADEVRRVNAASQPQPVALRVPSDPPVVVYSLMGITILIFILQYASQFILQGDLPAALGMKVNEAILNGEFWRLITPVFLHGDILHIAFNMYALRNLGPGLERHYGRGRFLLLYFLSAFAGNVLSFLFSSAPSLGSSTAIFGLLGAEGVFVYRNREIFGSRAQSALREILTFAGINLLLGLSPRIDNWGHIGGLIGGTLFAWLAGPLLTVTGIYPNLELVDERDGGPALGVGLLVFLLFALLVAAGFFLRSPA